ncbi:MAG: mismatch-specific uracil/thymine DNA-glycosylase [Hydrocarboniphaga sp.]|uniref:DNA-deoxyinosine glycosylase n=1 Tax=Hydrocarboniphaga sp. TaxID=2033016 RepID=UPI002603323A|nr:DNA-deoxyinosine glycosylase [Hydrocarboniphaga sp.]MDB5972943.1 mismatch-specific uracil/thymine DNA-glycosylase [Hydrocarboniphaga sp.]
MPYVHSFAPIAGDDARVLILGSMPGRISLEHRQYYAHPRNAFWPLMNELFGAGPDLVYTERLSRLKRQRVALWDVLKLCTREGSLDSAIVESSIECNDFAALFARCPQITRVYFNGAKAETTYQRYVAPVLQTPYIRFHRLPSTSPAHASLSHQAKLSAWKVITDASRLEL